MVTAAVGPDLVQVVEERDRGVCSSCGRDTDVILDRLQERLVGGWWPMSIPPRTAELVARNRAWRWQRLLARLGLLAPMATWRAQLWVVAFARPGGANVALDELRTICRPCRRRAEA